MYHTVNEYRNYLKKKLKEDKQNILESWGNGAYIAEDVNETIQYNARALGSVDALYSVIEYLEEPLEDIGFEYE